MHRGALLVFSTVTIKLWSCGSNRCNKPGDRRGAGTGLQSLSHTSHKLQDTSGAEHRSRNLIHHRRAVIFGPAGKMGSASARWYNLARRRAPVPLP